MKKKFLLSVGLLLGLWTFGYAGQDSPAPEQTEQSSSEQSESTQTDTAPQEQSPQMQSVAATSGEEPTPGEYAASQTQSMAVQGAGTPNLYTGTVSTSIPIYTYKDEDFTIPISLHYASNGYEPYAEPSQVALGWRLNAGGSVTQIVRGEVDLRGDPYRHTAWDLGEHYRMDVPFDLSLGIVSTNTHSYTYRGKGEYYQETEPDIYAFNFMGHSGKFIFVDGAPYIFDSNHPAGEYVVEVLEGGEDIGEDGQPIPRQYTYNRFVVTTGDGYRYLFTRPGKFISGMMRANTRDWRSLLFVAGLGTGGVWSLTRIVAPNGRTVTLDYDEYHVSGARGLKSVIELPGSSGYQTRSLDSNNNFSSVNETMMMPALEETTSGDIQYKHKIRKISVGDTTIDFFAPDFFVRVSKAIPFADSVVLKDCSIGYHAVNGRRFLDSVKISGVGAYKMNYYDLDVTNPGKAVDHWGYLTTDRSQGSGQIMQIFPVPDTLDFADFDFNLVAERRPNADRAKWGMLSRITYPTGGYTTFEYEPNSYKDMVTHRPPVGSFGFVAPNTYLPYLKVGAASDESEAGGLRISRISDYTADGLVSSRLYRYRTEDGACSGNLLVRPYYYFHMNESARDMNVPYPSKPRTLRLWLQNSTNRRPFQPHIEYERVEEVYDDGSYTAYEFADYHEAPDKYRTHSEFILNEQTKIANATRVNNFLTEPDFEPGYRGSLLATVDYDSRGRKIKERRTTYDTTKARKYIESALHAGDIFYIQRVYVEDFPVKERSTINYFPDTPQVSPIHNTLSFGYNRLGQVNYVNQNGGERIMRTTYVDDILYPLVNSIYSQMMSTNTIDKPLVQTVSTTKSGTEKVVSAEKFEYTSVNNSLTIKPLGAIGESSLHLPVSFIKLAKSYKAAISEPVPPGTQTYYETASYRYDNRGHVLQKTERNGLKTSYIWGYGGLLPVGVLVGEIPDVSLDRYNANARSAVAVPQADRTEIRNLSSLLSTFYTYDRYGNVTEVVDPTGRTLRFTYDAHGRLIGEYDGAGNLLRSHSYSTHTVD